MIKPLIAGRDLTGSRRQRFVIDAQSVNSERELSDQFPTIYQYLSENVRPTRATNRDPRLVSNWWKFRRSNADYRSMIAGLARYIATTETEEHRMFEFVPSEAVCEHGILSLGFEDAYFLGVLSSSAHIVWTLASGGTLEDRPRYNKTVCFDPFPFPIATDEQKARIRALGERLDAFRKERLAEHQALTMTKLYNVLEKLKRGEALDEKDKAIHEMGLVSVLKQIHDELDNAVADAYGWPRDLTDEQILERLVALNKERAAEERQGLVRWLRPEFQAPKEAAKKPQQVEAELVAAEETTGKPAFPKEAPDQVAAVRAMLAAEGKPIKAGELARRFRQGRRVEPRVRDLLEIMAAIGQAQTENGSRYFAPR